ncbi:cytochrome c biogenesis CcdA family protein [Baaleninema simplex]|uniref:cytochrome c biogenesis CcdA family protein n=1 Tax=Baaleninema simplex TaxID=2862350 RepID=UPI00034CEB02|nr:cytochrome c biogenesis protein CcdA [Baaleninema simplex]
MSQLLQAFVLGNSAILTNACMLPLYPGTIAFLSSNSQNAKSRHLSILLGVMVLAGILSMMGAIGFLLFSIGRSFSAILPFILPVVYGLVIAFGIVMLFGYNPFSKLAIAQAPVVSNPLATAYLYGLMFGPMTLPCTGPILTAAFLLSVDNSGNLAISTLAPQLLYALVFGLGFGWPLLVLPLFTQTFQRRFTRWLASRHQWLDRFSGTLLIVIGFFGIWTELLPNLR